MLIRRTAAPRLPRSPRTPESRNPRRSKTHLAAAAAARFGVLSAVRMMRRRSAGGLLALAYHRIGDPKGCPVDERLFSVSAEDLAAQVRILQRCTRVARLEEVEAIYASGRPFSEPLSLLTFDDAYRDNYHAAYPALREAGVSGVFFVATGLIECRHVPWWDRLAYAVKHSQVDECALTHPAGFQITGLRENPSGALSLLLSRFKQDARLDKERFVGAVEEATGACALGAAEVGELFARWEHLREMVRGGMDVASHTHTHRLLAHLSYREQLEELSRSKEILKQRLGIETRSVAYPVGHRIHFNTATRRALSELDYQLGFSHYNGWNPEPANPYDVRRVKIEPLVTRAVLEATVSWPKLFARPG